ncbi:ATP-binding cassette domain-containing protein [Pseudoxanthomonas koreensis]|uniref:ABC transporter ATP-binding protein n=1 Tax=Pseudoxanthomonas koreensis TaxID=266061 RepID=UPI0035A6938C
MSVTSHIQMRGVHKTFPFFTLHDLSFELQAGQVMGFVGPNGAGKSTTLRLAMGLMTADAGQVRVLGHPMPQAQAAAKRDIGYVSADMRLLPNATVGWHMDLVAAAHPGWDAGYAATLLRRFNLRPEQVARSLSHGEQTKAALLLALARRPRLLILDEPTNGLDPVARNELLTEFMDVMRDEQRSILFSSHNTVDVERICDRITFLDRGRIVDSDETGQFLERWRRIQVQLPEGATLPEFPGVIARTGEGRFHTLTTDRFDDALLARLGPLVSQVQRMSLEEIFVANVFRHREARDQ